MFRRLKALVVLPWLLAILAAILPGEAAAGTVLVTTDQFKAYGGPVPLSQNPEYLMGTGFYYKVVRLPAGANLKRLRYTIKCNGGSSTLSLTIKLIRKKPGSSGETIIDSGLLAWTGAETNTYATTDANMVGPSRVERGYRYFVQLHLNSSGGRIYDVRVIYR